MEETGEVVEVRLALMGADVDDESGGRRGVVLLLAMEADEGELDNPVISEMELAAELRMMDAVEDDGTEEEDDCWLGMEDETRVGGMDDVDEDEGTDEGGR